MVRPLLSFLFSCSPETQSRCWHDKHVTTTFSTLQFEPGTGVLCPPCSGYPETLSQACTSGVRRTPTGSSNDDPEVPCYHFSKVSHATGPVVWVQRRKPTAHSNATACNKVNQESWFFAGKSSFSSFFSFSPPILLLLLFSSYSPPPPPPRRFGPTGCSAVRQPPEGTGRPGRDRPPSLAALGARSISGVLPRCCSCL